MDVFHLLVANYLAFFAYLTYRFPKTGLVLLLALLPSYLIRFTVFGIPTTLLEATIWVVFLFWFTHNTEQHGWPRLNRSFFALSNGNPFRPYLFPILLWLGVATVSTVYSPNQLAALGQWKAYFVEPLMVFAMVAVTFRGTVERVWVPYALGASTITLSAIAALQQITGRFVPEPFGLIDPLRVTSVFPYPNALGLFVAPIVALAATWILWDIEHRQTGNRSLWSTTVVIAGLVAIIFSITKGALLGVLVSIFIVSFIVLKGWRRIAVLVLAPMSLVIMLVSTTAGDVLVKHAGPQSPSGVMRLVVWEESLAMLRDNPIQGAGLAGYQTALKPYHEPWRPDISPYKLEIFLYPHNVLLNVWSELGLAGVVVFLWILVVFFGMCWRQRHQPLSVTAMAAMLTLLVYGLVDVPYFKNDLAILFWVIVAMPLLGSRQLHTMHLHDEWLNKIKTGAKKIEAKLHDEKHQRMQIGDVILCYRQSGGYDCLRLEVVELTRHRSFTDLLDELHPFDLGYENKAHGIAHLRSLHSAETEQRHGVIGIHIERVE